MRLAVYCFGYNLNVIKYPWKESILAALDLVGPHGAVFFCECYSMDATITDAMELAHSHSNFRLSRHPWAHEFWDAEQIKDHGYRIQAVIANYLLDQIGPEYDFALKLDMDEVPCEWTFEPFRSFLAPLAQSETPILARPHYRHFCPDDRHTFPFIYESKAVISRPKDRFRFSVGQGGDACALGGAPEVQTPLMIHHYGKMEMGRREAALLKERTFQQLYTALGFPDPKVVAQAEQGYIDYSKVFDGATERGEFSKFSGFHPKRVRDWLAARRADDVEFVHKLIGAGHGS